MRAFVIAVVMWLGAQQAQAAEVKLLGWASDGAFIVDVKDPSAKLEWGNSQTAFVARCTPIEIPTTDWQAGCAVCGATATDAAQTCGLVTPATKAVSSLVSPDKKLTLIQSEYRCVHGIQNQHECTIEIVIGGLGSVLRSDDPRVTAGKKPQASVYFRPDSDAVMIDLWNVPRGVRDDTLYVFDVADLRRRGDVPALVKALVARQLANAPEAYLKTAEMFTDDATRGAIKPPAFAAIASSAKAGPIEVGVGTDGRIAWATFTATVGRVAWRATEVATRDGNTWRIAGGMWSRGLPDTEVNARATAGKLAKAAPVTAAARDEVPPNLVDTVAMMRTSKDDPVHLGAARPSVVVIGTAPAERTSGGRALDQAWSGWMAGGLSVGSVRGATVATGGWLVANLEVSKASAGSHYTIPMRVWLVVDKGGDELQHGVVVAHSAVVQ